MPGSKHLRMGGDRVRRIKTLLFALDPYCAYCGTELNLYACVLEHVIPLSRGGLNSLSNIVLSCADCDESKGDASVRIGEDNLIWTT